jgi:hypothetical protein
MVPVVETVAVVPSAYPRSDVSEADFATEEMLVMA